MAETKKQQTKLSAKKTITIKKGMKDYSNEPFFKKKAKAMNAILKKNGLPEMRRQS